MHKINSNKNELSRTWHVEHLMIINDAHSAMLYYTPHTNFFTSKSNWKRPDDNDFTPLEYVRASCLLNLLALFLKTLSLQPHLLIKVLTRGAFSSLLHLRNYSIISSRLPATEKVPFPNDQPPSRFITLEKWLKLKHPSSFVENVLFFLSFAMSLVHPPCVSLVLQIRFTTFEILVLHGSY